MRRLAITGDDFGLSREVNRAIAEAYDHGVLTRASLMINEDAAPEAISLARSRPGLSVGLHLVVLDGRATLPRPAIPRLVSQGGRFPSGAFATGLRYQFSRETRRQLAREIRAQLERFAETGLPLSHVDGHHHMHLHPFVLETLADLAGRFSIRSVRLPSEELGLALSIDPRGAASRTLWALVFRLLRRRGAKRLRAAGIHFADRVYGLLATGRVREGYLLVLIPRIRSEDVEIYCHPAAALPGQPFHGPPASGPEELAALVSERVRDAIARSGFDLARPAPALRRSAQ
ncbi:MAG: hopanoid biosynthesis-associated protein HpnK [Acidobacteriota bacterium]